MKHIEDALLIDMAAVICAAVLLMTGCKAPVTFSPLVTSEININDSANGNTVTPLP